MITPPRYKTARRLGAHLYEKTQSPKFAERMGRASPRKEFSRPKTDYGLKVLEKQRVRFTYGISERQFSKYVREANDARAGSKSDILYQTLELRLDNAVYRAGLAPTRQSARQMVSHGHITVDGKRVNIPSFRLTKGNVIGIRAGSARKKLFENLEEKLKDSSPPSWLLFNLQKREALIEGAPVPEHQEFYAALGSILEFYKK